MNNIFRLLFNQIKFINFLIQLPNFIFIFLNHFFLFICARSHSIRFRLNLFIRLSFYLLTLIRISRIIIRRYSLNCIFIIFKFFQIFFPHFFLSFKKSGCTFFRRSSNHLLNIFWQILIVIIF